MGPRGQEGYSQVPSAAAAVSVRHEEGVHAEESFLLTPSGTSICTSRTTHNDGHGKGRWGRLGRTMGCPRTKRRRKYCVGAALGFRILAVTILIVILGYIVAVSPIHYSDIVPSSQDTCGLEPDPIMRLKPLSTLEGLKQGAVASDHTVCSDVGKMILLRGGNAVDAAIATTLCLGVANPASSGIGGGMFMVIYADRKHHEDRWTKAMNNNSTVSTVERPDFIDARNDSSLRATFQESKMIEVIDAREVAPEGAYRDMFLVNHETMASEKGGLAIAVLGELRGLELAHARHGALDWAVLVEPAMRLARDGVPITKHLAQDIANQKNNIAKYGLIGLGKLLTRDGRGQTMLKEGDLIKNPTLAKTLEAVMKDGADAVYKGELAKSLVKDIQDAGGIITENDLHQYKATLRSPLISEASGFTIVGVPPPSSGGATIIGILRFLSGFSAPLATMADTLSKHRLVEAIRHAFAIRMSLSDPDYFTNVTLDATNDLINGNYMEELRQKLYRDNETAPISVFGGPKWAQLKDGEGEVKPKDAHEGDRRQLSFRQKRKLFRTFGYLEDHGTTHLSIIDSQGNAVSLTSTVNTYFGSGVVSESTGIILNNQMDDFGTPGQVNYFGLKPSEANFIEPRKRPLSSMAPMFFFKKNEMDNSSALGDLFMSIGASGGPKIITSVVQVFINHALLGMPLFEAMAHPRIHDQLLYHGSDVTCFEKCALDGGGPTIVVSNVTQAALAKREHVLLGVDYAGTVQAVAVDLESQTMSAVSDIRKGGVPSGY